MKFLRAPARQEVDILSFTQDMATLIEAGVTVRDAVRALARKEAAPGRQAVLNALVASMSQGLRLSGALRKSGAFPELLVATVAASEQTGDLAAGLARYARHQQSMRSVRDKVIGASVYPLLLLGVGSLVVAMLVGVVVPRFSRLLDAQGRELPLMSQGLLAWGRFADAHPAAPTALLLTLLGIAIALGLQIRSPRTRGRVLQFLPGIAPLAREFQRLQMYRTTAILTSGGVPVHRALELSSALLGAVDTGQVRMALQRVREGAALSDALPRYGLADAMATSMIAVAEKSGALSEILDRIADSYERSLQRNVEIFTRLIEPVLMIVFGILVGGIVLLMYLPIFDLASSVS